MHNPIRDEIRYFPEVSLNLYNTERGQIQNTTIEELFSFKDLQGWRKKIIGFGLKEKEPLVRVFFLHDRALKAELEAEYVRADFFFEKTYRTFSKLRSETLLEITGDSKIRTRIINELFIDLHLAFFKGIYISFPENSSNKRGDKHLKYVDQLITFLPESYAKQTIRQLGKFRLSILQAEGKLKPALQFTRKLNKAFPNDYSIEYKSVEILSASILNNLDNNTDLNEKKIGDAIIRLEKFRASRPLFKVLYTTLGECYLLLMSLQAEKQKYPHALLSLKKGYIYNPSLVNFEENWDSLTTKMELLISQKTPEVLDKLDSRKRSLRPNDSIILENYKLNYSFVNNFADSGEEAKLIEQKELADLWELCLFLTVPTNHVIKDWKIVGHSLKEAFRKAVKIQPQNETEAIERFLEELKHQNFDQLEISEENTGRLIMSELKKTPTRPILEKAYSFDWIPYQLTPKYKAMKKSSEPLLYWWFSRKNFFSKIFLSFSVVLFISILARIPRQSYAKEKRDIAYEAVKVAIDQGKDLHEITPYIEQFLKYPPPFGTDDRLELLKDYYEKEFASWFLNSEEIDPQQLKIYKKIQTKLNRQTH